MPVYMNLFYLADGDGKRSALGTDRMLTVYAEANREVVKASGFVLPLGEGPYTIEYAFNFGNPIDWGAGLGDKRSEEVVAELKRDKRGYINRFYANTAMFVNVFFCRGLKNDKDGRPVLAATLGHQTVLVGDRAGCDTGLALAHEIGHVFLGAGHWKGEDKNLMGDGIAKVTGYLDPGQKNRFAEAYNNRAAGVLGGWEV